MQYFLVNYYVAVQAPLISRRLDVPFSGAVDQCQRDGDVRIEGSGRVEYCRGGVWGAICLNSTELPWSEKNAQVVCKQLGFSGALNSVLPNTYVHVHYVYVSVLLPVIVAHLQRTCPTQWNSLPPW